MAAAPSDGRLKFIQDRIDKVEQHFGQICQSTSAYMGTLAKLRDRGDDVAQSLLAYAESESVNLTTKAALTDFVENFSAVEDFRNVQIQRLNSKVIEPMMNYGKSCKKAKRIKDAFALNAKELQKRKSATDKTASKNAKEQAQQQGTADAFRVNRELEDEIDSFERKKLHDIKMLMSDFVSVELAFHAKALEMYTLCYRSMTMIREDHDLQQFRESLRPLVRLSGQSDHLQNASNSGTSAGIFRWTPKFLEAIGKQRRRESREKDRSCTESTTGSPSSSSQCTSSSQNEENAGNPEDGRVSDSGEDDDETEE